jgi:hypothetical protein
LAPKTSLFGMQKLAASSAKPPFPAAGNENFPAGREFQGLCRSAMPRRDGSDK